MKNIKLTVLMIVASALSLTALASDSEYHWRKNQTPPSEWTVPDCDRVTGTAAFTFTSDDGATLAQTQPLRGLVYSYGLVTLNEPNTLLATSMTNAGTSILKSTDAGCSWREIELLPVNELLLLTAAPGGMAYGWSRGRSAFYRIEGDAVVSLTAPKNIYGLAVNPRNSDNIRIGTYDCQLYESFNGGLSFSMLGAPANTGNSLFYTVEFDPVDWDNALCGTIGAWRTDNAGADWIPVTPFDKEDIDLVYLFEYSPSDVQRVWARANLETMGENARCILVSADGGATFERVLDQGAAAPDQNGILQTLSLTNQPTMAAHPGEAGVLYVVFGTYFQDMGTNIFRYDVVDSSLTVAHIDGLDGIDAIAFNPADANFMYLGLESAQVSMAKTSAESNSSEEAVKFGIAPNPFNPATEISFSLPEAAQVRLNIYNLAGQKVATVIDAHMSAGSHFVNWDGSHLASGIYLARLEAGAFAATRKMVLLK